MSTYSTSECGYNALQQCIIDGPQLPCLFVVNQSRTSREQIVRKSKNDDVIKDVIKDVVKFCFPHLSHIIRARRLMNDEFAKGVYSSLVQTGQNSGDVDILAEWMRQYGTDVLNVAYSYVRNYQQAQDITQDVFLKAFNKMDTFRNDSSARTWLLSITVNRCKDYLRSWHYRNVMPEDKMGEPTSSAATPEGFAVHQLEQEELWQIVQELPQKYREVLVLFYLRDLSGHEIARVLHTTEQNVRTRLHRARGLLKQKLEEKGWDDESGL